MRNFTKMDFVSSITPSLEKKPQENKNLNNMHTFNKASSLKTV
jgi:hypothetical protein